MGSDIEVTLVECLCLLGLVLQVHMEQFPAPASGALCRCHPPALRP